MIFENAYFGKAYMLKDGRKAIYVRHKRNFHEVLVHGTYDIYNYNNDGTLSGWTEPTNSDVVSEWQEEIDEKELNKLAYAVFPDEEDDEDSCAVNLINFSLRNAYKKGYRREV